MASAEELAQENRILRERIVQLERSASGQLDPALRSLLEHAPTFLNVITPEGRFLATGRVSEAFGTVVGRSVFEFTEPSQHQVMKDAFAQACQTQRAVSYESVGFGENGEPNHTYVVRAFPVITEGRATALVLVPTDITDRVRLQRSMAESEQAMRLAVGAAHMGLWRWEMRRNEVTWDARTCEVFGVAEAPKTFEDYFRLVHPDDQALVSRVLREATETGAYPTFEHRLAPRAGAAHERWILAAGTVFKDGAGAPVAMLGGVLDVTDQKQLAIQMQRTGRVEALGELTAGIAHNFNNLLGAILPNLEIALVDAPDKLRGSLSAALDASLQARDLVKSLMALSLRRAATPGIPSDVADVVSRLDAICRLTFPKEIELQTVLGSHLGLVAMPASELEQVLLNLLFNARDAVMETTGGVRQIRLQVDRVSSGGGEPSASQIMFRVVDNGVGMSEVVRKQVFAPFFTTKPPHRGSGLGLANAMSRVQEAGGRLECESALGKGTTFTLWLPVGTAAAPAAAAARAPQERTRDTETILLVDDETLVRNVVARVLRSQRYEIIEAGSAEGAREAIKKHGPRISLVLLDQSMPAETGLEALPSLKEMCAAPVVLFTGLATDVPDGVAALLEKPARPAELLRLVRDVLDARARGA